MAETGRLICIIETLVTTPPPLPLSSSHEDHQRIVQVVTVCARDAVVSRDRHSAPRGPIIG